MRITVKSLPLIFEASLLDEKLHFKKSVKIEGEITQRNL